MKKTLLIINLFILVGVINIVHAENVGIIVELSDGTVKTDCVNVPSGTDGFQILEKSVFDILWSAPYIDILGLFGIPGTSFGQAAERSCKAPGAGTSR